MDDTPKQKKNALMIVAIVVLIVLALAMGFRNMIFKEGSNLPSADVQAAIEDSKKAADPPPAEPQAPVFSKAPKKLGGN